ncbi:MAG: hypothetical protein AB7I27_05020 [Bacteriovoracaceae bacterium]
MKNKILALTILNSICLNVWALPSDPLPQINPPKELVEVGGQFAEGTSTKLSEKDIALFIPWAQSAQSVLNKALTDIENMPLEEQVKHLQATIQNVVRSSGTKNYQMLMRFALNRTLLLLQELSKEADWHSSAIQANALDLSVSGIKTALQFYESDLAFQQRIADSTSTINPQYASFAKSLGTSLLGSIKSINDASAQYRLLYKTYEMVNWDLSRDDQAQDYSDTIVRNYKLLSSMDENPSKDDSLNVKSIRKLFTLDLDFKISQPVPKTPPAKAADVAKDKDKVYAFSKKGNLIHAGVITEERGTESVVKLSDGTYNLVEANQIYRRGKSLQGFDVGEKVIIKGNKETEYAFVNATIVGINDSKRFLAQDDTNSYYGLEASDLCKTKGTLGKYSVDEKVFVLDSQENGIITGFCGSFIVLKLTRTYGSQIILQTPSGITKLKE